MFNTFMESLDLMTNDEIKLAKDFIKSGIVAQKNEIRDLKYDIKAMKRLNKKDYRIDTWKNNIKWAKEEIKQMKKALWALRFAGAVKWFKTKWQQLKSFVANVIEKIKNFFASKEVKEEQPVVKKEVKEQVKKSVQPKDTKELFNMDLEEVKEQVEVVEQPVVKQQEEVKKSVVKKEVIDYRKYVKEEVVVKFVNYVASKFKELNKLNPGLFKDKKQGSVKKAEAKGVSKAKKLIVDGSIVIYLDEYVKNPENISDFINHVIKFQVKDFSKLNY